MLLWDYQWEYKGNVLFLIAWDYFTLKKPTSHLRHGSKDLKKHLFQYKNICEEIFASVESFEAFTETKENAENK